MNPLIADVIIYGLQVITFQFLATPAMSMLNYKQSLAKNKSWVKDNPKIVVEHPAPKPFVSYALGFIYLTLIGIGYFKSEPKLVFWAHILSVFSVIFFNMGLDLLRSKKIKSKIPKKEIRTAGFYPRTLRQYFPTWVIYLSSALGIFAFAGCLYQLFDSTSPDKGSSHAINLLVILLFAATALIYVIKKKAINADTEISEFYRRSEIYVVYSIFVSFMVYAILNLYLTYLAPAGLTVSGRWTSYFFTLIPMAVFVWFVINPKTKKLYKDEF